MTRLEIVNSILLIVGYTRKNFKEDSLSKREMLSVLMYLQLTKDLTQKRGNVKNSKGV